VEALNVLVRAKREALARLAKAEAFKRPTIAHAIAELDWAIQALTYINDQRNLMRRLQTEVELANVQIRNHRGTTGAKLRKRQSRKGTGAT
jgi:hypothetical protein